MPLPANRLLQSAQHVTAYVHIRFSHFTFCESEDGKLYQTLCQDARSISYSMEITYSTYITIQLKYTVYNIIHFKLWAFVKTEMRNFIMTVLPLWFV